MASTVRPSISPFRTARFGGGISVCDSSSRFGSIRFGFSGLFV
ncbi:hypothetical protein HanOQP8_Chr03g0087051 [Helianthus annuus]|nr:hypothetical protein HanOQP8_Chr03g0087051 [Helianthus annuus]